MQIQEQRASSIYQNSQNYFLDYYPSRNFPEKHRHFPEKIDEALQALQTLHI